jgi:V/A-type H+-transporting ATPase subunit I
MAVLPVEKIHIVVYKDIKDKFLQELQKEGIIHITEQEESTTRVSTDDLSRIDDVLNQLTTYKKRSPLSMFFNVRRPMPYDAFVEAARSYDHEKTVAQLESIKSERDMLSSRIRQIEEEISLLSPWKPFSSDLSTLSEFKHTDSIPVTIPSSDLFEQISDAIADIPYSQEKVNTVGTAQYHIFFVQKDQSAQLRARLIENGCEITDFHARKGIPGELLQKFEQELITTHQKIAELNQLEKTLSQEIHKLEAKADLLSIAKKKEDIATALPETISTTNIIGWVLKRDLKRLDKIVDRFGLVFYEKIEKDADERPPVALRNVTLSRPYEMLVKLYSMPDPKEYDPTPFLAFFFPVMFGLCITDALYGIMLILISLYLMRRVTGDKSLFRILFVGGILTIFAGAIVGGWGGDIFEYIGFQPLIDFRRALMLFDPVTNPMIFIAIALGLGFIHMMLGIAIEIYDDIKNGEYGQAIFANLTWFIILPAIILYFSIFSSSPAAKMALETIIWTCIVGVILASHPEGEPKVIDQIIWAPIVFLLWYALTSFAFGFLGIEYVIKVPAFAYLLAIPLLILEFTRMKEMKKVLGKAAWGLYNLYGISSYLGVLLSYVRLMALGMVTGVIAIAINKIAWMITGIPVLGIILVIVILIPSHLFNLIINALGGFIHTMRLQYIEFFGRFYSGGSKPFKPFQMETDYVEIK